MYADAFLQRVADLHKPWDTITSGDSLELVSLPVVCLETARRELFSAHPEIPELRLIGISSHKDRVKLRYRTEPSMPDIVVIENQVFPPDLSNPYLPQYMLPFLEAINAEFPKRHYVLKPRIRWTRWILFAALAAIFFYLGLLTHWHFFSW